MREIELQIMDASAFISISLSLYRSFADFVCDVSWNEWWVKSDELYSDNGPINFTRIGLFVTFSNMKSPHPLSADHNNR